MENDVHITFIAVLHFGNNSLPVNAGKIFILYQTIVFILLIT